MVEVKRCARCGCMIISEEKVCSECAQKDARDVIKLKNFIADNDGISSSGEDLAVATGIVNKNLERILTFDEFKNVNPITGMIEKNINL